jgi:hypothetical protein
MANKRVSLLTSLLVTVALGCSARGPAIPAVSADPQLAADAQPPAMDWKKEIGDVVVPPEVGTLSAVLNEKEQCYSITVPRPDLDVKIDGMPVPTSAGLASTFHFYHCTCGKMSVLGEFLVLDYEANDVIDALRAGNAIRITAVGAIAIGDRPRLLSVRFHGEGDATGLAKLVREALRWTGTERAKPAKQ